jgi:hypothetical protein
MKNINQIIAAFILLSILQSCGTSAPLQKPTPKYLYTPSNANLINVEKKFDFKSTFAYASSAHTNDNYDEGKQKSNGFDFKSAFAITNHLAVKFDVFKWKEKNFSLDALGTINAFDLLYKRNGMSASVGYFTYLDKQKQFMFNVYTGIEMGKTNFDGIYRERIKHYYYYKAKNVNWFITPAFTFLVDKSFSFTFASRLSVVSFRNLNTNDSTFIIGENLLYNKKNSVFSDFIFQSNVKLSRKYGISLLGNIGLSTLITGSLKEETRRDDFSNNYFFNNTIRKDQYDYNNIFGSVGIEIDLRQLLKKK